VRTIIRYHERLGDVLRLLPLARHLSEGGDEVFIECKDQYADILRCVTYCRHWRVGTDYAESDKIIDRQIWPERYEEWRKSGKWWEDFVFGEIAPEAVGQRIVLDNQVLGSGLGDYSLVAPFGISQVVRHEPIEVIRKAVKLYGAGNLIVLCPPELEVGGLRCVSCKNLSFMPHLIACADNFLGINSAPALIASAVREKYDLIPTGIYQDDYTLGASLISL
jgi:hypothetical protein